MLLDTTTRKTTLHYYDGLENEDLEGSESGESRTFPPGPSILDKTPTSERLIHEWLGERKEDHSERSLYCAHDGFKKIVPIRCKGRTCGECRAREFFRLAEQYRDALKSVSWPNFLTIAPKNVTHLTQDYLRLFHAAVKKVLRRKHWQESIKSGVVFAETTNIGHGWHPHMHGLVDARWIDPARLAKEMTETLGWSVKVHVKRWRSGEDVIRYCLGYLKKAPDIYRCDGLAKKQSVGKKKYVGLEEVSKRKAVFDEAHKGLRTVFAFGDLYGLPRPEKQALECPECGGCRWVTDLAIENMISPKNKTGSEHYGPRRKRDHQARAPVTFARREEILNEVKGGDDFEEEA